jgi:hypothetical protein
MYMYILRVCIGAMDILDNGIKVWGSEIQKKCLDRIDKFLRRYLFAKYFTFTALWLKSVSYDVNTMHHAYTCCYIFRYGLFSHQIRTP